MDLTNFIFYEKYKKNLPFYENMRDNVINRKHIFTHKKKEVFRMKRE